MIPKVIHQLWVGPKPRPEHWMRTWRELHPGWEYVLWDEAKVFRRRWVNQRHVDFYRRRKVWHGVSDVVRYEILFEQGGFMPEADSEALRPVDELFRGNGYDAYAVAENERAAPGLLSPLTAACAGSPFAKALIDGLKAKRRVGEPWLHVGNLEMKRVAESRHWPGLKVWPSHYFNPTHHTGRVYKGNGKIFARQFWGTSKRLY